MYQDELKQATTKRQYGDHNNMGIKSHILANQYNPKGVGRKRGRKPISQLLQELRARMINEGKVRNLTLTQTPSQ